MAKFEKTVVIAAPLGEVFDYVSQPEHFPDFLPVADFQFLTHMHRGVSTRVRFTLNLDGKKVVNECSLTTLELDKRLVFHYTSGMTCEWTITFEEVEGGTQVRWEGEYEAPVGFLDKLLGRGAKMQQAVEAVVDNGLQKLKEILASK